MGVVGMNGAGKSTLFAALLYGLYGQLSNKVKAENIANQNELQEVFKCYDLKGHIAFVTINVRNYRIMDIKNIDMPFIEVRKLRENINEVIKGGRRK